MRPALVALALAFALLAAEPLAAVAAGIVVAVVAWITKER